MHGTFVWNELATGDVPGVGRVAVLRDPTGAAIGWMTSPRPDPAG